MRIACVFTGQGAQKIGMGREFYEKYGEAKGFFSKASDIVGYDISKLIFEGPEEELNKTSITQPAVFLVSYTIYEIFKKEVELESLISFFAGHSLGEYTAVTAAGVLDFEKTIEVVKKRGELMEGVSGGGMSAVIGMDKEKIIDICSKYNVEAVNFNSPKQVVIAGRVEDLDRVEPELKNNGAKRVIRLKVSGAFHSLYMKEVQKEFSDYLDGIDFKDAKIPVVTNCDAKPHSVGNEIKDALKKQIASPVLWVDSMNFMVENGIGTFIEFGPARVLSNLIVQIVPGAKVYSVYDLNSFEEVKDAIKG